MSRLTKPQREALLMLQDMRRRYPDESHDGATCSDRTWFDLGATWPAFINWRTAGALVHRGLAITECVDPDNGWDIRLTDAGVALEVTR